MKAHCSPERTTRAAERSRQNNARIFAKAPLPVHTPVHPILQLQQSIGNQAVQRLLRSRTIQAKLNISQPGDPFEQEADRVAEKIMRMPAPAVQRSCASCADGGSPCPECEAENEKAVQRRVRPSIESVEESVPEHSLLDPASGRPLATSTRAFFEPRFGVDFGDVRLHTGEAATQTAARIHAAAFTYGRHIWLGKGESEQNNNLMAHELTHVVQQSQGPSGSGPQLIQRTTLEGVDNMCVAYEDRKLNVSSGTPLSETKTPGGRVIPGTKGSHQNCAGASLCGRAEYINWPFLGLEAADHLARPPHITADWDKANYFVPAGCKPVDCAGISINATRCRALEREVILFLYRWPAGVIRGTSTQVFQSDFHMIGRTPSSLPMAWESKMDQRERVEDIRDPWQSLHDAYPHTLGSDREVKQHCYCCDCGGIKTR